MAILMLQLANFIEERIAFGFGAALARSQAPVAFLAPVSEMRIVCWDGPSAREIS